MLDVRLPAGLERHGRIESLAAGSAVNAARTAARLGARAGIAGAIGGDSVGRAVELELTDGGVEAFLTRLGDASTGIAVYGARVVADRGANALYIPASLPEARVTLVSGYLTAAARDRAVELASQLRAIDLQIAGEAPPAAAEVVLGPQIDIEALAPHHAVVVSTLGAGGAVAIRGEERAAAEPRRVLEGSPVGAGDAFAAGFLLALVDGRPLDEALRAGCDAVLP